MKFSNTLYNLQQCNYTADLLHVHLYNQTHGYNNSSLLIYLPVYDSQHIYLKIFYKIPHHVLNTQSFQ